MVWWGWILLGSLLLCAELTLVDAGFYLVFFGAAALIVGVLDATLVIPVWLEWLLFAALCVLLISTFRRRLYARLHGGAQVAASPVRVGDTGTVAAAIAAGERGRAAIGGSTWTAKNAGAQPLAEGAQVRVRQVSGMLLEVEALNPTADAADKATASADTPAADATPAADGAGS